MGLSSRLLDYEATNAVLAWVAVGVLAAVAVERFAADAFVWAGTATAVVAVALVPPVLARDRKEMAAWEVLALPVAAVLAPYVGLSEGIAGFVAVAALALVVAVELDAFTAVEMTPEFAVAFTVIVTMAVAGVWVIARYASDALLGTAFLSDQTAVMWDLVVATGIGVVAGIVFELYFRRLSPGRAIQRDRWGEPP